MSNLPKLKKLLFLSCFLIVWGSNAFGQYYSTGQDPAGTKWKHIKTEHFDVIFPDGFDTQAQHVALMLTRVYTYATVTMKAKPKPISVILHNQTIQSNGYVALAPRRLEMYTVPDQSIYGQDWLEQLSIHEYRHVIQVDRIDSQVPLLLKLIFGEQATAAVIGVYVPFWFLEGDAVSTETALSHTGRGRLPFFLQDMKAQVVEKGPYSYYKAVLGSYKDYIPNRYALGFWLVGEARRTYGSDVWDRTLSYVGGHPFNISAFDYGLKKATGKNKRGLYHDIFASLREQWTEDAGKRKGIEGERITPVSKTFCSYRFARYYNDSEIIAEQSSMDKPDQFVLIDRQQHIKKLFRPGERFGDPFSLAQNKLVWAERRPDLRWQQADKSVICILNLKNRKVTVIRMKDSKPMAPSLSPDGHAIAFVDTDLKGIHSIAVYDLQNHKVIHRYASPENYYYMTPSWSSDSQRIFAIAVGAAGKAIFSFDNQLMHSTSIIPFTFSEIGQPLCQGKYLFFRGTYDGNDNIYAFDFDSKKQLQLTDSKFGTPDLAVSPDQRHLLVSDYSSDGYVLKEMNYNVSNWKDLKTDDSKPFATASLLAGQEKGIVPVSVSRDSIFPVHSYYKLTHLINFHSWAPAYLDGIENEGNLGISFLSQNVLSTLSLVAGYKYDASTQNGEYRLNLIYSGLYPRISFEYTGGKYNMTYSKYYFTWWQNDFKTGVSVPFNLSQYNYQTLIQPGVSWNYTQFVHNATTISQFYHNSQYLDYSLYAYHLQKTTTQEIKPKWGAVLQVNYEQTFSSDIDYGNLKAAQGLFYLPGIFKNQGLSVYGGIQQKDLQNSYFSDEIRIPRGYMSFMNTKLATVTTDYYFPICYPDLSLGKIAYLKRIKGDLFYDFSHLTTFDTQNNTRTYFPANLRSYGVEITFDGHFLCFPAPIEIGTRIAHLPNGKSSKGLNTAALLSINFYGF